MKWPVNSDEGNIQHISFFRLENSDAFYVEIDRYFTDEGLSLIILRLSFS